MKFTHVFRHLDSSKSLTKYSEDRMERLKRFEIKDCKVAVTYSAQRHLSHAEVRVHGIQGDFTAEGVGKDFFIALDKAVEKIESQMLKAKEKMKFHKKEAFSKFGKMSRLNSSMVTDFRPIVSGVRGRRAG